MVDDFDPIAYINEPRWAHSRLGLERIEALMGALGNPERELKFVHVAGTNGKGSTCAFLSSIFTCAGMKCGLFTSPYIERFEERIRIDGRDIPFDELLRITLVVKDVAEEIEKSTGEHPTEFELMCAVALLYFKQQQCDIVVMEVGLGGRLDSTNVITPELCVITKIGLDHCSLLGETIEEIAYEKAGIIKKGIPVVSAPQDLSALEVIKRRCKESGCELFVVDERDIKDSILDMKRALRLFSYLSTDFETKLLGSYQSLNASTAILAVKVLAEHGGFNVSSDAICKGVSNAVWPARFEVVASDPLTIVDGAHNPDGALALRDSLLDLAKATGESLFGRIVFVAGVLADKDYVHIIEPLVEFASAFVVYTPDNPRALSAQDLALSIENSNCKLHGIKDHSCKDIEVVCVEDAASAMCLARKKAGPECIVVAFGTLYSISDIKSVLL